MKTITTIGIDLAKNSFSVYGVDAKGNPLLSRTLSRTGVVRFFANLPSCLVGMEACASSEYWARADLQRYFGISRTPLRDAFRELERQGFVESVPRRGTFVKKINERDMEEVYLLRVNLEGMAAQLAHKNMNPARLHLLRAELDAMEQGAENRDMRMYMKHHDGYHDTFIRQSENRTLIEILEKLCRQTNWHRFYFSYHGSHFAAALDSHRDIHKIFSTAALSEDQVEQAVRKHILNGFLRFQQHIRDNKK